MNEILCNDWFMICFGEVIKNDNDPGLLAGIGKKNNSGKTTDSTVVWGKKRGLTNCLEIEATMMLSQDCF